MGDVLTSDDLLEGHNDLGPPMMIRPYRGKQQYTQKVRFVLQFKPAKFRLKMAAMTLRIMSRSNYSYGKKVLVRTIICDIEKDDVH